MHYKDVEILLHVFNNADGEYAVEFTLLRKESGRQAATLYPSFGTSFEN